MAVKNYGEKFGWEIDVDFPSWGNTEIYVNTISKGYLLPGEKPKDAYWRVATRIAQRLEKPQLATKFFDYIWKGWLNLATPVLSNTGTDRGLAISCFGIDVGDIALLQAAPGVIAAAEDVVDAIIALNSNANAGVFTDITVNGVIQNSSGVQLSLPTTGGTISTEGFSIALATALG